jgi:hypothetical protein
MILPEDLMGLFSEANGGRTMMRNARLQKQGIFRQAKKPRQTPVLDFPREQQLLSGFYHPIRSNALFYPFPKKKQSQ